jgi:hypothetical protein
VADFVSLFQFVVAVLFALYGLVWIVALVRSL